MTWWFCTEKDNAEKYVWIWAARWFDARRTAWTLLGRESLWITHPKTEQTRPPKKAYKDHAVYETEWLGSAAGLNDLHMDVRRVPVRKFVCECCHGLFWPWELLEAGGRLIHAPGEGSACEKCGPVVPRRRTPEEPNLCALPEAKPYPDEDFTELLQRSIDQVTEEKRRKEKAADG